MAKKETKKVEVKVKKKPGRKPTRKIYFGMEAVSYTHLTLPTIYSV